MEFDNKAYIYVVIAALLGVLVVSHYSLNFEMMTEQLPWFIYL